MKGLQLLTKLMKQSQFIRHFLNTDKRLNGHYLCSRQATQSLPSRTRRPGRERVKFTSCIR